MGGSIEDKNMYQAAGLLKRGIRFYALDSTDPVKLQSILEDIERRARTGLAAALRSTLVVGMAMGMTSYEPVVNLQKLSQLYQRHKIDSRPNFLYMTLPGSLLDQFAAPRGYRRVELQLDGENTTAGRHSGPLTRGSLYPLALAGVDLRAWFAAAPLSDTDILTAWRLAAFLHAQGEAGRDKVTLLLPKPWSGAVLWTKQDFEESLGKREDLGIKILSAGKPRLAHYRAPKDAAQDRVFLAVRIKGFRDPHGEKATLLRRAGYPLAALTFDAGVPLSQYMQFMHYAVFGMAYLRDMNFVKQPGVELYKSIAATLCAKPLPALADSHAQASRMAKFKPQKAKSKSRAAPQRRPSVRDPAGFGLRSRALFSLLRDEICELITARRTRCVRSKSPPDSCRPRRVPRSSRWAIRACCARPRWKIPCRNSCAEAAKDG
jgi:glucose-6-phosphate isomerase